MVCPEQIRSAREGKELVGTNPSSVEIGPDAYAAWRASILGAITEAIELRLILRLAGPLRGQKVLDVGCGDGVLTMAAAELGADVTGIDPDPRMLDAARRRSVGTTLGVRFAEGGAERLPYPDSTFDTVLAVTVLCLIPDADTAVREIARVLKPGGRLVIGELGRWNLWAAWRRIRGWFGSRTWRHARFRTVNELRALAEGANLSVIDAQSAVFYPPIAILARLIAPADGWLGRKISVGAAFHAIAAAKLRSQ